MIMPGYKNEWTAFNCLCFNIVKYIRNCVLTNCIFAREENSHFSISLYHIIALTWKSLTCLDADSTWPTQVSMFTSRASNLDKRSSDSLTILGLAVTPLVVGWPFISATWTASSFGLSCLSCDWAFYRHINILSTFHMYISIQNTHRQSTKYTNVLECTSTFYEFYTF